MPFEARVTALTVTKFAEEPSLCYKKPGLPKRSQPLGRWSTCIVFSKGPDQYMTRSVTTVTRQTTMRMPLIIAPKDYLRLLSDEPVPAS